MAAEKNGGFVVVAEAGQVEVCAQDMSCVRLLRSVIYQRNSFIESGPVMQPGLAATTTSSSNFVAAAAQRVLASS